MGPGSSRYHPPKALQDRRHRAHQHTPLRPGNELGLSLEGPLCASLPRPARLNTQPAPTAALPPSLNLSLGGAMPKIHSPLPPDSVLGCLSPARFPAYPKNRTPTITLVPKTMRVR